MDRHEYELFEYRPDGSLNWRGLVRGLENAPVTVWLRVLCEGFHDQRGRARENTPPSPPAEGSSSR